MYKTKLLSLFLGLFLIGFACTAMAMTDEEQLGQRLYFDKYLSLNQNQACASCHLPATGFVDPMNVYDPYNNVVSLGSDRSLNGGRNAPTSGYAAFIPAFGGDAAIGFYGGQFWDGRADTLKDQAKGPFTNRVEMGMADPTAVVAAIVDPQNKNYRFYKSLFASVYRINLANLNLNDAVAVAKTYDKTAQAIAVFEQSNRFHKFSSKFDYYLAGEGTLTDMELAGLQLFNGKANCAVCHPSGATQNSDGTIVPPLFSDYTYDNLGVPKSENALIADFPIDYGLGGRLEIATENGKFRVPSLRNIALTPPYAHNGYFATLEEIVHFYNTAGINDGTWAPPEVDQNVNRQEVGDLGLTAQEEAELVAFLKTLSDGDTCQMPTGYVLPPITPLN